MSAMRLLLPVVLGVVAAALNFMVLRGGTAPLELTTIRSDVKADTVLTDDMLEPLPVRADAGIFKSAVPYKQRGVALLNRRVNRAIGAGEALLFTDVRTLDEENFSLYLKPGESTLTVPVQVLRVSSGLQRGDSVGFLVAANPRNDPLRNLLKTPAPAMSARRMLGPFRLLSLSAIDASSIAASRDLRLVTVAVTRTADGRLTSDVAALDEALSPQAGANGGVLAVERYVPAK